MTQNDQARIWRYEAERADGSLVKGDLKAQDEADALRRVRTLGLRPVKMRGAALDRKNLLSGERQHLNSQEIWQFSRNLADLLEAGIPLGDALSSLAGRKSSKPMRRFVDRIEGRVRNGESLSAALKADSSPLPRLMLALTRAGEESGLLARHMGDLADRLGEVRALRQEITSQMIYPLALLVLIALTLVGMSFFVIPQFEGLFASTSAEPPDVTRLVFNVAGFLRDWAVWIPVIGLGVFMVFRAVARLHAEAIARFLHHIPGVGSFRVRLWAAQYCQSLAILLRAGTPLSRAEMVAREAVPDAFARQRLDRVAEQVRAGVKFSEALDGARIMPDETLDLIALGEKSGELPAMLSRAAGLLEMETRHGLKRLVDLTGPAMTLLLALCVAAIIAAVLIGVLSLNDVVF